MGRTTRGHRRNVTVEGGPLVEFGELLDPIAGTVGIIATSADRPATTVGADVVHETGEDTVSDTEPESVATAIEPLQLSRFADAGLDDDRLPLRSSTKRRRRGSFT